MNEAVGQHRTCLSYSQFVRRSGGAPGVRTAAPRREKVGYSGIELAVKFSTARSLIGGDCFMIPSIRFWWQCF